MKLLFIFNAHYIATPTIKDERAEERRELNQSAALASPQHCTALHCYFNRGKDVLLYCTDGRVHAWLQRKRRNKQLNSVSPLIDLQQEGVNTLQYN
jgi:hypothetical protein